MTELRTQAPEAVLANTLLTFPMVEAAARLNIPCVWIIHESYSAEVLARLFPPYARHRCERAFGLASRVIPASHDTAALFQRATTFIASSFKGTGIAFLALAWSGCTQAGRLTMST